jgi:RHS repeat-associated protein
MTLATATKASPYQFNGKETLGFGYEKMIDMQARNYMADIGRWGVIDELSESFNNLSPYNFSNNNPISFSDPTGLAPQGFASTFINPNGKVVEHRDDGDNNVYLVGDDWKKGGSKEDLSIVGKEKKGMIYTPGLNYQIDNKGELGIVNPSSYPKTTGFANQMDFTSPFFAWGWAFKGIGAVLGVLAGTTPKVASLVKIVTIEQNVMIFSSKIGGNTVEGITNFAVKDGVLTLEQLHLQGSTAGNVGRKTLWEIAKDLGKQFKVEEVMIQGGKRTTGKFIGQVPSPITIKVN